MNPNWDRIRAHYKHHEIVIARAGASDWGIDPYAWDHDAGIVLTPIESSLWTDIRSAGLVMYPQYPVGRRFVDFGNPVAKVAIECDGAAFHQDKQADEKRECEIRSLGWEIYRFPGWLCKTPDEQDEQGRWGTNDACRQIARIGERHGIRLWTRRGSRTQ